MKTGWTVAVFTFLAVAPSVAAGPAGGCLPGEAGEAVSRLVASGRIQQVIPAGWSLESADIEVWRLVLTFRDAAGGSMEVRLVSREASDPDGTGRWFAFEIGSAERELEPANREHLLRAARLVDTFFAASPWIDCPEALGTLGPVPESASEYVRTPTQPQATATEPATPTQLPPDRVDGGTSRQDPQAARPDAGTPPANPARGDMVRQASTSARSKPARGPLAGVAASRRPAPLIGPHLKGRYWFVAPWLYLLLGLIELALIAAGLWSATRWALGRGEPQNQASGVDEH